MSITTLAPHITPLCAGDVSCYLQDGQLDAKDKVEIDAYRRTADTCAATMPAASCLTT